MMSIGERSMIFALLKSNIALQRAMTAALTQDAGAEKQSNLMSAMAECDTHLNTVISLIQENWTNNEC